MSENNSVGDRGCKIHIVVVNWNAGDQLHNCIRSIYEYCRDANLRISVVDNCSSDGSDKFLVNYPNVELIKNNINCGFGRACNLGVGDTNSEFILFINPDAALSSEDLINVIEFMEQPAHADVGICGVQLADCSGRVSRSCARFPTPIGFVFHAIGLDRFYPRLGHFMAEWPHDETKDVDHVIGAFYFVRYDAFKALGGFDERFFVYLEDLDFSYRARMAGWRSVYLADVQAFHAGGGTSNQVKAKRLFYSLRSRLLYAFKHFSLFGALLVLMSTLLLEPFSRSALAVIRRSWTSLIETWSGYGMLFRWLPQWIFKGVTR